MKRLNLFVLAFAALGMVFTSCEPTEDALGPSLEITGGETIEATGGSATIAWRANAGDANLATISILEGNTAITSGGITWNEYEIPTASNEAYVGSVTVNVTENTTFTITVTDKDGLTATKTVNVTVATALSEKSPATLGASNSATGSYYSVSTSTVYTSTTVTGNESKVDFVYNSDASTATFKSPKHSTKETVANTGRTTLFQKVTTIDFATATAADLDGVTPTNEDINVVLNDVVVFKTQDNIKGIFKVTNITVSASGTVTIGIKVKG